MLSENSKNPPNMFGCGKSPYDRTKGSSLNIIFATPGVVGDIRLSFSQNNPIECCVINCQIPIKELVIAEAIIILNEFFKIVPRGTIYRIVPYF